MKKGLSVLLLLSICGTVMIAGQSRKADSLETLLKSKLPDTTRLMLHFRLARELRNSDPVRATSILRDGLLLAEKCDYPLAEIRLLREKGTSLYIQGSCDSSLAYYFPKALEMARQYKLREEESVVLSLTGDCLMKTGKYPEALKHYESALKIHEELGNPILQSNSMISLGNMYYYSKNYPKALESYGKAYELKKKIGDRVGMIKCLTNLTAVSSVSRDYEGSLKFAREGITLSRQENQAYYLGFLYTNVSNSFVKLRRYDSAEYYYRASVEMQRKSHDNSALASSLAGLADLLILGKRYPEAKKLLDEALPLAEAAGNLEVMAAIHLQLTRYYQASGDHAAALGHHEKYSTLKDSLFNVNTQQIMKDMQVKYETAEKDKQLIEQKAQTDLKDAESRRRTTERNAALVAFGLILVLAFFIYRGYRDKKRAGEIIARQKEEVEVQKMLLEAKNKEILDSIHYARRIQVSLLPSEKFVARKLMELNH